MYVSIHAMMGNHLFIHLYIISFHAAASLFRVTKKLKPFRKRGVIYDNQLPFRSMEMVRCLFYFYGTETRQGLRSREVCSLLFVVSSFLGWCLFHSHILRIDQQPFNNINSVFF